MSSDIESIQEALKKMGSEIHHINERFIEHTASETGCRDTVQALAKWAWGNGKPGVEANLSDVKTDVAVIREQVGNMKEDRVVMRSMRNQIFAGAVIAVIAAILGAIF